MTHSPNPNQPRINWKRPVILIPAIALVMYLLIGFIFAPLITKLVAPYVLSKELAGTVKIKWIWMNPLTGSVTLRDLRLLDNDGSEVITINRFHLNADPITSLFKQEWVAAEFSMHHPRVNMHINEAGILNLTRALSPTRAASGSSDPFDIPDALLRRLNIEEAEVHFRDDSLAIPFAHSIVSLNLNLNDVRTQAHHQNVYQIAILSASKEIIHVDGHFQLNPLSIQGNLTFEGVELGDYASFHGEILPVDIASGLVSGGCAYFFHPLAENRRLGISDGHFKLEHMALSAKDSNREIFTLEMFELSGLAIDLLSQTAGIATIAVVEGALQVRRYADGNLELVNLAHSLTPEPGTTTSGQTETLPATPLQFGVRADGADLAEPINAFLEHLNTLVHSEWRLNVNDLKVSGFSIEVDDLKSEDPVRLKLYDTRFSLSGFTNQQDQLADFDFFIRINEGSLVAKGELGIVPVVGTVAYEIAGLDLNIASPIMSEFLPLHLDSGMLSSTGSIHLFTDLQQQIIVEATADSTVADFALRLEDSEVALAAFDELKIFNSAASSQPLKLHINEVRLVNPLVHIERLENGDLEVMRVLEDLKADAEPELQTSDPTSVPANSLPNPPLDFKVQRVVIQNASLDVRDASVQPVAAVALNQVDFNAENVALDRETISNFTMTGKLNSQGSISVKGGLILMDPTLNTTAEAAIRDIPLTGFSPYALDLIGRPIQRGEFSGDFNILVNQTELEASNQLRVHTLRFGPATGSGAMQVPVGMAIAVLEDQNGLITLDVPISGDLDNPSFNPTQIFMNIVTNTATRAITAPLRIAGSLLTGSIPGLSLLQNRESESDSDSGDLSEIQFAAGSAELDSTAVAKLEMLSRFLNSRPHLNLQLVGHIDPAKDGPILAKKFLHQHLQEIDAADSNSAMLMLYEQLIDAPLPELSTLDAPVSDSSTTQQRLTQHRHTRRTVVASQSGASTLLEVDESIIGEMESQLLEVLSPNPSDLQVLAQARADATMAFLTEKIDSSRVSTLSEESSETDAAARVAFQISSSL